MQNLARPVVGVGVQKSFDKRRVLVTDQGADVVPVLADRIERGELGGRTKEGPIRGKTGMFPKCWGESSIPLLVDKEGGSERRSFEVWPKLNNDFWKVERGSRSKLVGWGYCCHEVVGYME